MAELVETTRTWDHMIPKCVAAIEAILRGIRNESMAKRARVSVLGNSKFKSTRKHSGRNFQSGQGTNWAVDQTVTCITRLHGKEFARDATTADHNLRRNGSRLKGAVILRSRRVFFKTNLRHLLQYQQHEH
ncbi:hypothetical protein CCR75_006626 [Bremia lactucae]|uniref:Uncharacterized protein n=1 Tax=Bremia lactucae TaxID=4779 RepID=A0A976FI71_BRELC|nr:hypothetical protein CCR75_006626 [Bremia lactucae]